ncbi:hypothetical protein T265_00328 [Opisthorchis viverrini]|uniref:Uncharacterized protein n=1 Tax=Opisthorchis viverrini TaxID=6198 RepID=A0A075ACW9_OPIVI|nr:hypothetical protein T265_00328 [Opisthorchis viverrini]KER33885.1 hypothetical protein T265_00328 [Opisthorchis viverrini]
MEKQAQGRRNICEQQEQHWLKLSTMGFKRVEKVDGKQSNEEQHDLILGEIILPDVVGNKLTIGDHRFCMSPDQSSQVLQPQIRDERSAELNVWTATLNSLSLLRKAFIGEPYLWPYIGSPVGSYDKNDKSKFRDSFAMNSGEQKYYTV